MNDSMSVKKKGNEQGERWQLFGQKWNRRVRVISRFIRAESASTGPGANLFD